MNLLRDKKEMTRFLILYRAILERPGKLSDLSAPLGMTQQGVSNYISEMEEEGLLDTSGKKYHPTPKGMEIVRKVIAKLNTFIDEASQQMDLIKQCTAMAEERVEEGDEVGLYMAGGFLRADTKGRTSTGIALTSAAPGEPLAVGDLQGITEMNVGRIYIIKVGLDNSLTEAKKSLEDKLSTVDHDVLAVTGEAQYGLAVSICLEPDIVFAPQEAAINAAERGLNVALIISEHEAEAMIDRLQSINREREDEFRIDHTAI